MMTPSLAGPADAVALRAPDPEAGRWHWPAPGLDADAEALYQAEAAAELALFERVERQRAMISRLRLARARHLAVAIAQCDRRDALAVMSAAIADLGAGMPSLLSAEDEIRERALWWADTAAEVELVQYACAAMARLQTSPLGLPHRKRLLAAIWKALPDADRRAFLARVDPRGNFQGRQA
jgi:hypothetical protein